MQIVEKIGISVFHSMQKLVVQKKRRKKAEVGIVRSLNLPVYVVSMLVVFVKLKIFRWQRMY